ncbi:hypothetical protein GX50_06772 [[Emmonsia] crescens]|uniref:Uncharacterized protein n=1 Tax=[Emmonsia] crescens TaxID=73230 RepID=A0A2B7ZAS6_9EURO|nr:hypothetical protein GX50_06772 [Emmonsia crescens]
MPLSIKHQLQRWTVQQLHRIGFTNVTLSTPLPTRGDGSTFDIDDDYDARPSQLRGQHGHSRAHSSTREKSIPTAAYSGYERAAFVVDGLRGGLGGLEGWLVLVGLGEGHTGEKDGYFIPVEGVDGPVGHAVANRGRAA